MYEVVMPQLSDSMDEGKLISWKVSVGESVKSGDVIAEVESDKAIMEVQTFQDGFVSELLVKEGESAKVGSIIARISTQKEEKPLQKQAKTSQKQQSQNIFENNFQTDKKETQEIQKPIKQTPINEHSNGLISPKARAKAAAYGIDSAVISKDSKKSIHSADVEAYIKQRYFTPKAQQLLQEYKIEKSLFTLDHKVDAQEVREYIKTHEIPLPKVLTTMQKAIISNVESSAKKPVFHLYESADATLLTEHKERSITVWFIKIIAHVMMEHEAFRSKLFSNAVSVMPNASISLAVADKKDLYMPVIKDANTLEPDTIEQQLQTFKTKLRKKSFTSQDMQGSTFGISNLGMLGVERFDAMINKDDTAILAIGTIEDKKITITLTVDHRLVNGYEAALFMADLKKELQNPLHFKKDENVPSI